MYFLKRTTIYDFYFFFTFPICHYVIKNKHCNYIYLGKTSLIDASMSGHLDLVKFLVDIGADVHAKTKSGKLVYIAYEL